MGAWAIRQARLLAMPTPSLDAHGHGSMKIHGLSRFSEVKDAFHSLMHYSWFWLIAFGFALYTGIATLFALLFWADVYISGVEGIRNTNGGFADRFFFSVQTMSTIGFGYMAPISPFAHTLVLVESFGGMVIVALFTGVLFAKLSKPRARISFTSSVCHAVSDGKPTLSLRLVNQRLSQLLEAKITLSVVIKHMSLEGEASYRVKTLHVDTPQNPIFVMGWRVIHQIDEKSPLYGLTEENCQSRIFVLQAVVSGIDEVSSHYLCERHVYNATDIAFGKRFSRMISEEEDNNGNPRLVLDLNKLEDIEEVPPDMAADTQARCGASRRMTVRQRDLGRSSPPTCPPANGGSEPTNGSSETEPTKNFALSDLES